MRQSDFFLVAKDVSSTGVVAQHATVLIRVASDIVAEKNELRDCGREHRMLEQRAELRRSEPIAARR